MSAKKTQRNLGQYFRREIERAYPLELRRELAKRYGIDPDHPAWHHGIRKAAAIYLAIARLPPPEQPKDKRDKEKRLRDASAAAELLREKLADVSYVFNMAEAAKRQGGRLQPRGGLTGVMQFQADILEAINIAGAVFSNDLQKEIARKLPRGRPGDTAVYRYVDYLSDYLEMAGLKLTIDYHKGVGLTRSYHFFADCIRPIATISEKKIISAMRKKIAERSSQHSQKRSRRRS